jgi:hypothetical protein
MTTTADWHDFATMIGGASGALTGLLFVAVSLNASRIAGHTGLRASAAQTLILFITPLLVATTLLVPRQPDWVLGTELIVTGLLAGVVLSVNHHVKLGLGDDERRLISIFNRPAPNVIAMALVTGCGIIVAAGHDFGIYLLFPASVLAFVSGMVNAWFFLLPPPGGQPARTASMLYRGRGRGRGRREAPADPPADPPADSPADDA